MDIFTEKLAPNGAELTCYLQQDSWEMPTASVRPAMLVLPGGGYVMCSDREAEPIALAYLAEGFNAFVLRYSVNGKPWERAHEDGAAALRYIREHAGELHIDPAKVAAIGFSAGGHLAACLGAMGPEKPDALLLGYPVILPEMGPPMGIEIPDASAAVDWTTPPSFLFASSDDGCVPVENALSFAQALAKNAVYFEMRVYLQAGHGFSTGKAAHANGNPANAVPDTQDWLPDSVRFLRHVFGDFPLDGKAQPGTLPPADRFGPDTPIRRLAACPACVSAMEAARPGLTKELSADPMESGKSLRMFAQEGRISQALLQTLAKKLGAL